MGESYTDPGQMSEIRLMMEYRRLVEEAIQGIDEDVPYSAGDLEREISMRLREYEVDRY